jgi:hypothetical protein
MEDKMDHHPVKRRRRLLTGVATAAVAAAAGLALAGFSGGSAEHASAHDHPSPVAASSKATGKALRFHDQMRKLWEDHIVWTRLTIVSFAAGSPDLQPTLDRLLQNQEDIGDAIKPFYGRKAAAKLTALLKEHINGAVAVLVAAKAADQQAFEQANQAWYANGREIADFLHRANPRFWRQHMMRSMMRTHLDQTLAEGAHRLAGDFAADIRDYEAIHRHILRMADALSAGIVADFPRRFR